MRMSKPPAVNQRLPPTGWSELTFPYALEFGPVRTNVGLKAQPRLIPHRERVVSGSPEHVDRGGWKIFVHLNSHGQAGIGRRGSLRRTSAA